MAKREDDEPADISLVTIDPYTLDKEWVNQPKRYLRAAEVLAGLREKVSEYKAVVDLVEAGLGLKIRSDPGKYDIEKVTEAMVAATIVVQPEYQEAVKKHNRAKYKAEVAEALVTALEHRKRALEKMVDLHAMSYYAEPKAKRANKDTADELAAKAAFGERRKRKD